MADPSIENLQWVIGDVVRRIGEVRFQRRLLPSTGTLYQTVNGLYFVPHVLKRRQEIVECLQAGRSLFWILASLVFAPLMFIVPFIRSKKMDTQIVTVYRPANLRLHERHRLAELLMKNPGAFFISTQSIQHITRKRRQWLVDRRQGGPMRFSAIVDPEIVEHRMTQLTERDSSWERDDV